MATSDEQKGRAYVEREREKQAFLDKRIPELHAEGKPATSSDDPDEIEFNLSASRFPGVLARKQALKEWAARE